MEHAAERKEKREKDDPSRDSTTHLLLSGQMSYPVRLEGHQNERLASECIITDANSIPKVVSSVTLLESFWGIKV